MVTRKVPVVKKNTLQSEQAKRTSEIDTLRAEMAKKYGAGSIVKAADIKQPWRISTGIFPLDLALCGGIPYNRVTQYNGKKHSGKTTGAELVLAQAQRSMPDHEHVFVDIEGTRDATWGRKLGVDNDRLLYVENTIGEQVIDIIDGLVRTKEVGLIVVDSLAALTPFHEMEASAEDNAKVAGNSKLITSFCRKIGLSMVNERRRGHYVTLLVINQDRAAVGVRVMPGMPPPVHHPGGKAWEHLQSVDVRFSNLTKYSKDDIGQETAEVNEHKFKVDKCKMNPGIVKGEYQLLRRDVDEFRIEGMVDDAEAILAHAKRVGYYTGGGKAWTLKFGPYEEKYENAAATLDVLIQNPDFKWELRTHLIADHAARLKMDPEFIAYLLSSAEAV